MIEVKNITKKFGPRMVLDNLSFSVKEGEILGFLGPNGAGKTTTMKIITSFLPASSGEVCISGVEPGDFLEARKRIGYLAENVPLYEDMKVHEFLKFAAEARGMEKHKILDRIEEVLGLCGLKEVSGQIIEELSKGYKQRVGLAGAIIHDPDILILDEPTTGLDPNQIIEIRDLIKKIGREKTVIFSTHILSEAGAISDRIMIINKGKIVGEGTPRDLIEKSGQKEIIYVKIKGLESEVLSKLQSLENVIAASIKDREGEGIYGYEVEPAPGTDLREHLSIAVMDSGWSILEFSKRSVSLEDVFRELTK